MKTADTAARGQLFARVPAALMAEVEAAAGLHFRNVSGEILAALDAFVHLDQDALVEHQWRYEGWYEKDVKPVNIKVVPQDLLDSFHEIAARYKGDGQAFAHALELWVGGQTATAEEFKYASG